MGSLCPRVELESGNWWEGQRCCSEGVESEELDGDLYEDDALRGSDAKDSVRSGGLRDLDFSIEVEKGLIYAIFNGSAEVEEAAGSWAFLMKKTIIFGGTAAALVRVKVLSKKALHELKQQEPFRATASPGRTNKDAVVEVEQPAI